MHSLNVGEAMKFTSSDHLMRSEVGGGEGSSVSMANQLCSAGTASEVKSTRSVDQGLYLLRFGAA